MDPICIFLAQSIPLASDGMDAVARFGSAHGCAVRIGAVKGINLARLKNAMGGFLLVLFSLVRTKKMNSTKVETTDR